jgi:hypothetical protein
MNFPDFIASAGRFLHGIPSGQPHNDAVLILMFFMGALALAHIAFWRLMKGHRWFWQSIDYVWYAGTFLSLLLGAYQFERDAEAARISTLTQVSEVELQRQNLITMSLVSECGRMLALDENGEPQGFQPFDLQQCKAAKPILDEARLYVFEHLSGVDPLFSLQSKLARMSTICAQLDVLIEEHLSTHEADAPNPAREIYFTLYCDDAKRMQTQLNDRLAAAQSGGGSLVVAFNDIAHLWPLLLALLVAIRLTKVTAELLQSRGRS